MTMEATPASGSCQCGAITYTVAGEPLMTYACHCRDCQKRTGSAFSMGSLYPLAALNIQGELTAWERRSDHGHVNTRFSCARCGNIIYGSGSSAPEVAKLQPGTLDDSRRTTVDVHIWTRRAQTWISLPIGALCYDTQPDDMAEVLNTVLTRKAAGT